LLVCTVVLPPERSLAYSGDMSAEGDRSAVLKAAMAAFAARGYASTTLKGVAAAAGVAPQVLKSYYDNKEQLFAAAMRLPYDPATAIQALLAPGLDGMGERLVRLTFATFNDEQVRKDIGSIMRTGGTAGRLAGVLSEYIEFGVVDRVVANLGLPDVRLRVALISSFLMGIAAGRYIAKIPPLDTTDEDLLVRIVAPTIQDLLDPSTRLGEN
jgi:AcrR family transcriptional regulator